MCENQENFMRNLQFQLKKISLIFIEKRNKNELFDYCAF